MNIPRWLVLFLSEHFNGAQVAIIAGNWHRCTQISLSNSDRVELLATARTILRMVS